MGNIGLFVRVQRRVALSPFIAPRKGVLESVKECVGCSDEVYWLLVSFAKVACFSLLDYLPCVGPAVLSLSSCPYAVLPPDLLLGVGHEGLIADGEGSVISVSVVDPCLA